jgi:S-adenosylmethionine hydrolase
MWKGGQLVGEIVSVDRFGNLISNISRRHMEEARAVTGGRSPRIHISTYTVERLVRCYSEGDSRCPFALINSNGLVEIFVKEGSAARTMGVGPGQRVDLL